jgi:Zn-dependent metalloprotease
VVHLEADQRIYAVNAQAAPTPSALNAQAFTISAEEAIGRARDHLQLQTPIFTLSRRAKAILNYAAPVATRYVWIDDETGQPYLIWHVQIRPNLIDHWYYFIDAANGDILKRYNATAHDGPATAQAQDLSGTTRTLNVYEVDNVYYMIDGSRPIFQPDQPDILNDPQGALWTLDLQGNDAQRDATLLQVSSPTNTWNDPVSVSAHFNVGQVFDYYFNTHNRRGIDGNGSTLKSLIHVTEDGQPMDNAYWNGAFMIYGDGNQAFSPLAGGLDVAAHEMTHGVIQHTVNLEYQFQSGALNESFADVFGVMVDRDDWRLGEDVVLTSMFPSGALRDMEDPHNGGTSRADRGWQPSHMNEFVELTIDEDNGGVHVNSGIPNKACHLIGVAIGRDKTERIYYRILEARYLNTQSNFADMRMAAIRAATDLFGTPSSEVDAVSAAFDAVGITGDGTPPPAPLPPVQGTEWIAAINAVPSDASLYLMRPVIQSDDDIVPLTATQVSTDTGNPIAVPDTGEFLLFIDSQHFIRIIRSDGADEQVVGTDGVWKSIALSPDGSKLAATTTMEDRTLFILDLLNPENSKSIQLYTPTTGTNIRDDLIVFADALDWDLSGQFVIYDAFNRILQAQGNAIEYWDVNLINIDSEVIVPVFPPQPEGISIGNPSFGQTNDTFLVFDFVDFNQGTHVIMAANRFEGTLNVIESNGSAIGFPRYSPDDRRLVFQQLLNDQLTLRQIPLAANSTQPEGPSEPYISDGQHPTWFTIGSRPSGVSR